MHYFFNSKSVFIRFQIIFNFLKVNKKRFTFDDLSFSRQILFPKQPIWQKPLSSSSVKNLVVISHVWALYYYRKKNKITPQNFPRAQLVVVSYLINNWHNWMRKNWHHILLSRHIVLNICIKFENIYLWNLKLKCMHE